jgi:hypothetical protein
LIFLKRLFATAHIGVDDFIQAGFKLVGDGLLVGLLGSGVAGRRATGTGGRRIGELR